MGSALYNTLYAKSSINYNETILFLINLEEIVLIHLKKCNFARFVYTRNLLYKASALK